MANKEDSSDSDAAPAQRHRKRIHNFSDSDGEKENIQTRTNDDNESKQGKSDSETETNDKPIHFKSQLTKSRIVMGSSSSDSEDDAPINNSFKNEEQQMRMKNKKNKLKQKFDSLLIARSKHTDSKKLSDAPPSEEGKSEMSDETSDTDLSSIANIKQKIKKSMSTMQSICDPDTSDDESNMTKQVQLKIGKKKIQKSTKIIEAKPMRMTAKQAIENMQIIKSESNRMLREKAVSLPYHRPKALSLKDIMARRKQAIGSDGKALPLKMNKDQLKDYALQLEQRQKEMMELCKSESDEDNGELEEKDGSLDPDNSINEEVEIAKISDPNMEINMETNANTEVNFEENTTKSYIESREKQCEEINDLINGHTNQNDSNSDIKLVYNDSVEEVSVAMDDKGSLVKTNEVLNITPEEVDILSDAENCTKEDKLMSKMSEEDEVIKNGVQGQIPTESSEQESQLVSLHYTENGTDTVKEIDVGSDMKHYNVDGCSEKIENVENDRPDDQFFSDDDVNMEDIDKIIENAEIMKDNIDNILSPMLVKDPIIIKPKLVGAPGMVIDLDGGGALPKLSGIELLKERFTYFAKLKTPEEQEREREKRVKPGAQHLKLKQELEEKIAEQRSLEWAKRLEEEKQLHEEMDAVLDNADDSVEEVDAKIDKESHNEDNPSESETEEDLIENDIIIEDKPRKRNPMIDQEAEESDVDESEEQIESNEAENKEDVEEEIDDGEVESNNGKESSDDEKSSDEESSEDEELSTIPKKGRILKAFEDSDDEDGGINRLAEVESASKDISEQNKCETEQSKDGVFKTNSSDIQSLSQDCVIQLAQRHKSVSEDLFISQESSTINDVNINMLPDSSEDLGTQTFSISSANPSLFICPSQPSHDPNLNGVTEGLPENILDSQLLKTQSSQSQPIGEDILAMCTGQFYDNQFVSLNDENNPTESVSQDDTHVDDDVIDPDIVPDRALDNLKPPLEDNTSTQDIDSKITEETSRKNTEDRQLLKSLIDELDDPEFNQPKPNKFFTGANNKIYVVESNNIKKRLIIDSDDETNETNMADESKKKKKLKKRKEKRVLQISDDEDDEQDSDENGLGLEEADDISDVDENVDRLVEYDSEENEIEVKPDKGKKKNRKATDFFEQEAELTSEDEWMGSGDEDERDLDRMEREEGDDEVFHQGQLRKELGQIHMRDVLDQDKREVRILQELLFEDGDLGGGHRQRKFRWRNAGDEETGTVPDDLTDTQEEEFESEEQWRKQRHERELFLRQMQNQEEDDTPVNITMNRTTMIKANLTSKSMSTLIIEANQSKTDTKDSPAPTDKKSTKDVPSPQNSFSILQQKYHNSILNRGNSALARLAALATPLAAADDDAPKIASLASHKRNFVFATLTQEESQPKVTIKRKADINLGTPKLVKKIRLEEKKTYTTSLLDHLNT